MTDTIRIPSATGNAWEVRHARPGILKYRRLGDAGWRELDSRSSRLIDLTYFS